MLLIVNTTMTEKIPPKPRLGISACLLGEKVRYDGAHKRDAFLTEIFGRFVEWVPVCPEVEVGMGVPRETVQLIGRADNPQLVGTNSGENWTKSMQRFAALRTRELAELHLSGYVFKKNSPSCGVERVRVFIRKTDRRAKAAACSPRR